MSGLLAKSAKHMPAANGQVQCVTPQSAGWEYVGFEMYHLQDQQKFHFNTEDTEVCIVLVADKASIQAGG